MCLGSQPQPCLYQQIDDGDYATKLSRHRRQAPPPGRRRPRPTMTGQARGWHRRQRHARQNQCLSECVEAAGLRSQLACAGCHARLQRAAVARCTRCGPVAQARALQVLLFRAAHRAPEVTRHQPAGLIFLARPKASQIGKPLALSGMRDSLPDNPRLLKTPPLKSARIQAL